jgi:hypothetical protein
MVKVIVQGCRPSAVGTKSCSSAGSELCWQCVCWQQVDVVYTAGGKYLSPVVRGALARHVQLTLPHHDLTYCQWQVYH